VDEYRTLCLAPPQEVIALFEAASQVSWSDLVRL